MGILPEEREGHGHGCMGESLTTICISSNATVPASCMFTLYIPGI
jgi:hypothetical protein